MFEKFGEFDSVEELNRAAAGQKAEGDEEALLILAEENGIDREDAEDYISYAFLSVRLPLYRAYMRISNPESRECLFRTLLSGASFFRRELFSLNNLQYH